MTILAVLQKERFLDPERTPSTLAMMDLSRQGNSGRSGRKLGPQSRYPNSSAGEMSEHVAGEFQKEGLLGPDNIFNHCTGLSGEAWEDHPRGRPFRWTSAQRNRTRIGGLEGRNVRLPGCDRPWHSVRGFSHRQRGAPMAADHVRRDCGQRFYLQRSVAQAPQVCRGQACSQGSRQCRELLSEPRRSTGCRGLPAWPGPDRQA